MKKVLMGSLVASIWQGKESVNLRIYQQQLKIRVQNE